MTLPTPRRRPPVRRPLRRQAPALADARLAPIHRRLGRGAAGCRSGDVDPVFEAAARGGADVLTPRPPLARLLCAARVTARAAASPSAPSPAQRRCNALQGLQLRRYEVALDGMERRRCSTASTPRITARQQRHRRHRQAGAVAGRRRSRARCRWCRRCTSCCSTGTIHAELPAAMPAAQRRWHADQRAGDPGPSKTADIQQALAYGAHGPRELIVLAARPRRAGSTPMSRVMLAPFVCPTPASRQRSLAALDDPAPAHRSFRGAMDFLQAKRRGQFPTTPTCEACANSARRSAATACRDCPNCSSNWSATSAPTACRCTGPRRRRGQRHRPGASRAASARRGMSRASRWSARRSAQPLPWRSRHRMPGIRHGRIHRPAGRRNALAHHHAGDPQDQAADRRAVRPADSRRRLHRGRGRADPDRPPGAARTSSPTPTSALSGVNFAVAETGTLCLVENEGNGRMCTTVPTVHIAVTGIEKVVREAASTCRRCSAC